MWWKKKKRTQDEGRQKEKKEEKNRKKEKKSIMKLETASSPVFPARQRPDWHLYINYKLIAFLRMGRTTSLFTVPNPSVCLFKLDYYLSLYPIR